MSDTLLSPVASDEAVRRDQRIRSLKDAELRQFWPRFENQARTGQDQIAQPVLDRILAAQCSA